MELKRQTRVLVRTLPLSNGNYGGILQAYALQQVLLDLGLSPATDLTISNPLPPIVKSANHAIARVMPAWFARWNGFAELRDTVLTEKTSRTVMPFVDQHIVGVSVYRNRGVVDTAVVEQFDKVVVGSDQVWRRRYGDVPSYLFDFVTDPKVRIISYAASFGHDVPQGYGKLFTRTTRRLTRRFHSISVREASAVEVCEKYWGIQALQHVDPTMLLSPAHYRELATEDAVDLSPQCLTYILDESAPSRSLVDRICGQLGMAPTKLFQRPTSYAAWREDPHRFQQPTVQTWLKAFSDAEFVVTDSFHGTVFAILNHKPFIAINNSKRGSSRFDSLLEMFKLQERLVSPMANDVSRVVKQDIDWQYVDDRLAEKRDEAFSYLRGTLVTDSAMDSAVNIPG